MPVERKKVGASVDSSLQIEIKAAIVVESLNVTRKRSGVNVNRKRRRLLHVRSLTTKIERKLLQV